MLISRMEVLDEPKKPASQSGIDRAPKVTQQCPRAWRKEQEGKNCPKPSPQLIGR